jgi:hypothetical protein
VAEGFADWQDLCDFALTLPDTAIESHYGRPALKVRGKAFVASGREPDSCVLMLPMAEKEVLLEAAPEIFWQTDHYRGWPAVLVRFGQGERDWLERLVVRAWWDKAPAVLRKAHGSRP